MSVLIAILVIAALLTAMGSCAAVSEATQGVWLMCGACFLAILARLCQASADTDRVVRAISVLHPPKEATPPALPRQSSKAFTIFLVLIIVVGIGVLVYGSIWGDWKR